MINKLIHIALCFNEGYVMPAGILLISMFETNKENKFFIHVFSEPLTKESEEKINQIFIKYNAKFKFYKLSENYFSNFRNNGRFTMAANYRLVIPYIVDKNLKKILYLDSDMIVNGDLMPLWETDIDSMVIGAVEDIVAIDTKHYQKLNIPEKYGYFNSGALLINLARWREEKATEKIMNILNTRKLQFPDQDALNIVLYDKRKKLSPLWNQQVGTYYCFPYMVSDVFPETDLKTIKEQAVIIHFNAMEKPWHYVSSHPYSKIYRYYLKMSGLKNIPEEISLRKILKKQAYKIFGWRYLSHLIYQKQKKLQNEEITV